MLFAEFYQNHTENPEYFIEQLINPGGLSFGTQLNGGYANGRIPLGSDQRSAEERFRRLLGAHCVIRDRYWRRIYEGRGEDVSNDAGVINLNLQGYYNHGAEALSGLIYTDAQENYAHDLIADAIDLTDNTFGTRVWNTAKAFLEQTDLDLGSHDFSQDTFLREQIERALRFGYKELDWRPIYLTIYNHRHVRMFPEPSFPISFENDLDWLVPSDQFVFDNEFSFSHSRKGIYNKVHHLYDDNTADSAGPTFSTSAKENNLSQNRYGIREAVINATQVPESVVDLLRDIFIERNAFPKQSFRGTIKGFIQHSSGHLENPYMVRAGDTLAVIDRDTNVGNTQAGPGSSAVGGFVTRTDYNADSDTLTIEVGTDDKTLEMVLGRWGISGGLS